MKQLVLPNGIIAVIINDKEEPNAGLVVSIRGGYYLDEEG